MIALFFLALTAVYYSLSAEELHYTVYIGYAEGEMNLSWNTDPENKTVKVQGEFKVSKIGLPGVIRSTVDAEDFTVQRVIWGNKESKVIDFDQEKHVVTYPDTQLVIPEKTFDLLGLYLALQEINLDSLPQVKWVHFDKQNYKVVITKKGKEGIRGKRGKFQHVVLSVARPQRSNLDIHFWLAENPQVTERIELNMKVLKEIIPVTITADLSQKDP